MRNGLTRIGVVVLVAVAAFEMFSNHHSGPTRNVFAGVDGRPTESEPGVFAFVSQPDAKGLQRLYVVNPAQQVFAVYRVENLDKKTQVTLGAVRNFAADLQISEYNTEPKVAKIEEMLGQKPRRQ